MEQHSNNWKKRTKGKHILDVTEYDFYSFYIKNTVKENRLSRKQFNAFIKDLMIALTNAMIDESLEIKIPMLGAFRVRERKLNLLNHNNELAKLKPDWGKTWEYWRSKYSELTDEQIIEIKNKKLIYHDNEHSNQYYYHIIWEKRRCLIANNSLYNFIPNRLLKSKLSNTILDNTKQVFYYG